VFEKFTERSRRVLVLSLEEAHILSHSFVGTEHLLLGLIAEDEGVAAQALKSFGMSLKATRDRVEQMIGLTPTADMAAPLSPRVKKGLEVSRGETVDSAALPSPRVKKVFELSLQKSLDLGHNYVGTEHLLLGLIEEGEGLATQVLRSFDVDGTDLRQKVIQLLSGCQEGTGDPSRSASEPRCTGCRSRLSDTARFRSIQIPPSSSGRFPITIDVAFCIGCGLVFGSFRSEAPQ
jgi:ATP-dependent Clp protease ATP-binding subunit ClpC